MYVPEELNEVFQQSPDTEKSDTKEPSPNTMSFTTEHPSQPQRKPIPRRRTIGELHLDLEQSLQCGCTRWGVPFPMYGLCYMGGFRPSKYGTIIHVVWHGIKE